MHRAVATVLLLSVSFTGCQKWVEVESPRRDLGKDDRVVRLTRTDGTTFRLCGPRVRSDSLVGSPYEPGHRPPRNAQRRYALSMESVERVEIRTADPAATEGLALGVAGLIGLMTIQLVNAPPR